jgi:hypothetical protein
VIEGAERLSDLGSRFLVPSDRYHFVYLEEERYLVSDTRKLAQHLAQTVATGYPAELVAYSAKYGWPVAPVVPGYKLRLDVIHRELKEFQSFDDRWRAIVATAGRKRRLDTATAATQADREQLASDVVKYLSERGVGVMFEASGSHVGLTLRIRSGGPITTAVLRLAFGWSAGGSDRLPPIRCAAPGCVHLITDRHRRDQVYCSSTCRQRARRARG